MKHDYIKIDILIWVCELVCGFACVYKLRYGCDTIGWPYIRTRLEILTDSCLNWYCSKDRSNSCSNNRSNRNNNWSNNCSNRSNHLVRLKNICITSMTHSLMVHSKVILWHNHFTFTHFSALSKLFWFTIFTSWPLSFFLTTMTLEGVIRVLSWPSCSSFWEELNSILRKQYLSSFWFTMVNSLE